MNIIDFAMAVPMAIAIASLFSGILLVIGYLSYKITDNKSFITNLLHSLNQYYILWLGTSVCMGYIVAIILIYKTFF